MASFQDNGFATMLCPGWMLGVIEGNAKDVTGWDVANIFPGGGGNWGGSYLTVPTSPSTRREAKALAAWLDRTRAADQGLREGRHLPEPDGRSRQPELAAVTVPYFNDAPTGKIFAERAKAVTVSPFKGPKYFPINDALQQALTRVEDGSATPEASWEKFVADVEALG